MRTPSEIKNPLVLSALVIFVLSFSESLTCWNASIGCPQPWEIGFFNWLNLLVGLLLGPFSPYFHALFHKGPSAIFLAQYTISFFVLAALPYIYYFFKPTSSFAPIVGVILWLLYGHIFNIGIYI